MNSLNAHNLPIFQPILMILVSKCMVHRALSDKTYLSLGLLSPLSSLAPTGYFPRRADNQKSCILNGEVIMPDKRLSLFYVRCKQVVAGHTQFMSVFCFTTILYY